MGTVDTPEFDAMLEEAKWGLMKSKPASYWIKAEMFAEVVKSRAKDRLPLNLDGVLYIPAESVSK